MYLHQYMIYNHKQSSTGLAVLPASHPPNVCYSAGHSNDRFLHLL